MKIVEIKIFQGEISRSTESEYAQLVPSILNGCSTKHHESSTIVNAYTLQYWLHNSTSTISYCISSNKLFGYTYIRTVIVFNIDDSPIDIP